MKLTQQNLFVYTKPSVSNEDANEDRAKQQVSQFKSRAGIRSKRLMDEIDSMDTNGQHLIYGLADGLQKSISKKPKLKPHFDKLMSSSYGGSASEFKQELINLHRAVHQNVKYEPGSTVR